MAQENTLVKLSLILRSFFNVYNLRMNQVDKIYHKSSYVYLTSGFELLANVHKVQARPKLKTSLNNR